MQRPARELIHSLQSLRSFEIKFRHVVVAEDRSMTIIFQMEAARGQEPLCDLPRSARNWMAASGKACEKYFQPITNETADTPMAIAMTRYCLEVNLIGISTSSQPLAHHPRGCAVSVVALDPIKPDVTSFLVEGLCPLIIFRCLQRNKA